MKIYNAKTLFSGVVVGKEDKKFVGIPGGQNYVSKNDFSSEKNFKVIYNNQVMFIKNWHKAEAFRKFDDRDGRGTYILAYFEFKPYVESFDKVVNPHEALIRLADRPEWIELGKKLHGNLPIDNISK